MKREEYIKRAEEILQGEIKIMETCLHKDWKIQKEDHIKKLAQALYQLHLEGVREEKEEQLEIITDKINFSILFQDDVLGKDGSINGNIAITKIMLFLAEQREKLKK